MLLWSNHFYGLCAALLSIETTLSLLNTLPSLDTICLIYFGTVLYYTHAYLKETPMGLYNDRTLWYLKYQKYLYLRQLLCSLIVLYILFFKLNFIKLFFDLNNTVIGVLFFSFIISILYYFPVRIKSIIAIRAFGFMKSASIAWVWSVMCCLGPILLNESDTNQASCWTVHFALYFLQQFIFIFILAILFDIKDIPRDKKELVHTIVLKYGIQSTIRKLVTPLVLVYLIISFIIHYFYHQSLFYSLSQLILILTLYFVITIIQKISQIHINILLIDGLMLLKAMMGIMYALN